jgi:hypothetical protein
VIIVVILARKDVKHSFTGLHLSSVLKPSLSVPALADRAVLDLQTRRLQNHFLRPVDVSVAQCLIIRLHNEGCTSLKSLFIKISPYTATSGNTLISGTSPFECLPGLDDGGIPWFS